MNNPNIHMLDFEYDLEERFIRAIRSIFAQDDEFVYNKDNKQTKLIVSSAFPNKDEDFKIPQILVSVQNIAMSSATSLFNNYNTDIIDDLGVVIGETYATTIPYNVAITCLASGDSTSKNLSNKVFKYIIFTASEIFNDTLSLNIQEINKSVGSPFRQIPDKAFANSVALRGTLYWQGRKMQSKESMNIIEKIKLDLRNNEERGVF